MLRDVDGHDGIEIGELHIASAIDHGLGGAEVQAGLDHEIQPVACQVLAPQVAVQKGVHIAEGKAVKKSVEPDQLGSR
ncbi:MAG: hypothetical protein BWY83_03040 [bacterium ADurb.Bin478]|nr:MAG: hypothetical protein BWY83_03040 [bacterium ADurb.Bin478]